MTLYFDTRVDITDRNAIATHIAWHPVALTLAVATYSEERGGCVNVFGGDGKISENVDIPSHPTAQVYNLLWHPSRRVLVVGWETGELLVWNDEEGELHEIQSLHRSAITVVMFSSAGSRMVTGDSSGSLVGWKADSSGILTTWFTHELKDPLVEIVFRAGAQNSAGLDLSGLARAAISGDERALDIFSSWRPKTSNKRMGRMLDSKENLNFFLGSSSGILYHVDNNGRVTEVLQAESGIKKLLHHEGRSLLIVITEGLVLGQFSVAPDGAVSEITKVKISGRSADIQVSWISSGVMAVSTGDSFIRLWNLDSGENYVLELQGPTYRDRENIICLSYSLPKKTLCAGTNQGSIAMWKYEPQILKDGEYMNEPEKNWKLQSATVLPGAGTSRAIKQVAWGSTLNFLAANCVKDVYLLSEQEMAASCKDLVSVVQVSPSQLSVDVLPNKNHLELRADIQVRGVSNTSDHIIIWDTKKIVTYEIISNSNHLRIMSSFACETERAILYEGNIYSLESPYVQIRSLQGTIKQTLKFNEEGQPICIDICGNFMIVATINGIIKVFDLSRREAKLHHQGRNMSDIVKDFGEIISARCNCKGTKASIAVAHTSLVPNPKLYIWDIENDSFTFFNFASGRSEDNDYDGTAPPNSAESTESKDYTMQEKARYETAKEVGGRFVMTHMWDVEEPRLLGCEAQILQNTRQDKTSIIEEKPCLTAVSLFISDDYGIIVQDVFPLSPEYSKVLSIHVPFFYLLNSFDEQRILEKAPTSQKVLRDFSGLEDCDKLTREAMLNFSFYLSIGNMDEAFKAIKSIKSETVWENMAKMCIKTKRLDVASLCLGNMGFARGAKALRIASKEPELDAKVGILAVHLGMVDEAQEMFKSCNRYDLLNKVYQDKGQWSKAIETAVNKDRIHIRSTHYNYAKHLESKNDLSGAMMHYEKSDTHRFEVPRMLFDELSSLEEYILHTKDLHLRRWWAQYLESTGEMEAALQYYEAAGDHLSLVRVYCYCNNLEKAAAIANETNNKAACYHLARQYENINQVKDAIHFFTKAQAYGNAIRICKENGYDDQLMNLALLAGPQEKLEVAKYFISSDRPQVSRAVILYHKAGYLFKAVDLAFKSGQMSAIVQIANELTEDADPEVIKKCAEYLKNNGQHDKAVSLFITGKQYDDALDMCVKHNVWITEELADKFTLPKDENARNKILEKVADCAYAQENYKLATKKYTQAGNKIKAMKSLLKSGDTERIVYFANVCRQNEIYIMAANYLQSLDWRQEREIMLNIIKFYSRAKAITLLARFYESCAQVEIDEYQNYEKAAAALLEAYKCLTNSKEESGDLSLEIQYQLEKVKNFINCKASLNTDPDYAIQNFYTLINEEKIESAVRKGDIFAAIVEYYVSTGNLKAALGTVQEMKSRLPKANAGYYISSEALQAITKGTGIEFEPAISSQFQNTIEEMQDEKEEESEDSIVEEDEKDIKSSQMPFRNHFLNGSARLF